jgi:3-methyladenine DNA glycosylase AlkD
MNMRIIHKLIVMVAIWSLLSNLTLLNDVFAEIPNNTTTKSIKNTSDSFENVLANLPLVINITKNSNATDTVIDFVIDEVNSSVVDSSILQQIAQERIPLLIETLKNTNATSIVAEYVLNATKASVLQNNQIE